MGQYGMTFLPAPTYVLARAAWILTLVIWRADGRFTRLEGAPCEDYAAALAASWRLRPAKSPPEPRRASERLPHEEERCLAGLAPVLRL